MRHEGPRRVRTAPPRPDEAVPPCRPRRRSRSWPSSPERGRPGSDSGPGRWCRAPSSLLPALTGDRGVHLLDAHRLSARSTKQPLELTDVADRWPNHDSAFAFPYEVEPISHSDLERLPDGSRNADLPFTRDGRSRHCTSLREVRFLTLEYGYCICFAALGVASNLVTDSARRR